MNFFRYRADIFPITLFFSLFLFDLGLYFLVGNIQFLMIYAVVSIPIKWFIGAWNHHHQHVQTFQIPLLNRILEVIYGFQTGIVWYGWVLHHNLGHHMHYQDQKLDESAWKSSDGKTHSLWMYTWIVGFTAYSRSWKVGKKYPKIQRHFLSMMSVQWFLLVWLLAYHPLAGILIFLLPMITGLFLAVYTTYDHHTGLESESHYESSYNITSPIYNLITGNLGYHTAHHMKGSLHWSKLPEFHREIAEKIDEKYYRRYNPFRFQIKQDA